MPMLDDWRAELSPLQQVPLYRRLVDHATDDAGSAAAALVQEAVWYGFQRTKTILRHMGEFTLHDGDHLFRVVRIMDALIPEEVQNKLSTPEIMLLILTAFFHDAGMAPAEQEVLSWHRMLEQYPAIPSELKPYAFARYLSGAHSRVQQWKEAVAAGRIGEADTIRAYLVTEFIRQTHAERAREIITTDLPAHLGRTIVYRDMDLSDALARLCISHNEDSTRLLDRDAFNPSLICGPQVFACLPFIGVILRLADILDFDGKRTPDVLFNHLWVRHPVSIKEWQKHRAIQAWTIGRDAIAFSAACGHPAIEEAVRQFCMMIERELAGCSIVLSRLHDTIRTPFPDWYKLSLPLHVDTSQVGAKRDTSGQPLYQYRQSRFTLSQNEIIDLLMGTKLYERPDVAMREAMQNSIDACIVRAGLEQAWGNAYEPRITITLDTKSVPNELVIADNGTGMSQEIVDKYYCQVGRSYYRSAEFEQLRMEHGIENVPISRFGIGVLSFFMVADGFTVETARIPQLNTGFIDSIDMTVEGIDKLFWFRKGHSTMPGTTVRLRLKAGHPWSHLPPDKFADAIRQMVPGPSFPIEIVHSGQRVVHSSAALASRVPSGWGEVDDHTRVECIDIDDAALGFRGTVRLAFLVDDDGNLTREKSLFSKEVTVEGSWRSFTLENVLTQDSGDIIRKSDSLEVNGDEIDTNSGTSVEVRSDSELAVHGIACPAKLFPPRWFGGGGPSLDWPVPAFVAIDVIGRRDLDLNAARTLLLENEKWHGFASDLSFAVLRELRSQMEEASWEEVVAFFNEVPLDAAFADGLRRACA